MKLYMYDKHFLITVLGHGMKSNDSTWSNYLEFTDRRFILLCMLYVYVFISVYILMDIICKLI